MKLVYKLLGPDDLPWKQWFFHNTTGDLGASDPTSFLDCIVHEDRSSRGSDPSRR